MKRVRSTLMRRRGAVAWIAAGLLALSATHAQAAEDVKVRLSFTPFAAHLPVYVAKAKGFYEKAGLNVEILPGRGSSFAAMTAGSGTEEFGIADAAAVVTARSKGIPVIAVANLQQDNGAALFATEKSGITKIEDLKGRNVGVYTGSTTTLFLQALLKKNDLTLNDVKPVTVRAGTDLPLVLDGKIDAEVTIYNNELIAWGIQHPDLKLRVWHMRDLGFDTPGYAIVTNESLAKQKPQVVRGFTAATLAGVDYAIKNPQEAVTLLTKAVPELKENVEGPKWKAMIPGLTSPATEKTGLGTLDKPKWQALNALLKEYGVIEAEVNLDQLLQEGFRTAKN